MHVLPLALTPLPLHIGHFLSSGIGSVHVAMMPLPHPAMLRCEYHHTRFDQPLSTWAGSRFVIPEGVHRGSVSEMSIREKSAYMVTG
jgi:hypothetical protein